MKKIIISILICIFGAVILAGGTSFAMYMNYIYTVSFDKYSTDCSYRTPNDITSEELDRLRAEKRIKYPGFANGRSHEFAVELSECYAEVDNACRDYALLIAYKYNNNADLNFTVENTGKVLTIRFTGTGYPENGDPEPLSRTYNFDIEGVGADKLPKLLNRAEIIGY